MRFRDPSCRSDRAATPTLVLGFILALAAVSACTDARSPAAPEPLALAPPVLAVLDCSGSARGIKCVPSEGNTSNLLSDRIIGGQDVYVRLEAVAGTMTYDPVAFIVSQQVTVQNLTVQPFGTANWVDEGSPAMRVFFHTPPSNGVTVVGPDGTDTFTASGQEYYLYQELIPANQKNFNSETWSFDMPTDATTFTFQVYVSAKQPDEATPLTIPPHTFTALDRSMGGYITCAVRSGGTEYCWGYNGYGQLGLGDASTSDRNTPAGLLGNVSLTGLVHGAQHTCGLTSLGAAYCWGANFEGQLGDLTTTERSTPTAVDGGLAFSTLFAGGYHTCGLTSAGVAYCWGQNDDSQGRGDGGQIGDGTIGTDRLTPTAVGGSFTFSTLIAGGFHTCGITLTPVAGQTRCWGWNGDGQLGDNTPTDRTSPTLVAGGFTFTALAAAGRYTCARTSAGAAYCWGINEDGNIGDGTTTGKMTPTAVLGGHTFTSLIAAGEHTCGITSAPVAGASYCWGENGDGQLGDGTQGTDRLQPKLVEGGFTFTALAAASYHTCGLTGAGIAYCWGYNGDGQLGDGTFNQRSLPLNGSPVVMP